MKEVTTKRVIFGILGALFILILAQILAQAIGSLLAVVYMPAFICNAVAGVLYFVIAYILLKIFSEKGLKFELSELGIPRFRVEIKWLITAFVLPLSVAGIYLLLPGTFQISKMDTLEALTVVFATVFFTGLAAGAVEEMVFRGFIMNLLGKKLGKTAAIVIPSILFGAVHIIGTNFSLLSCLQVLVAGTLVGVMFSLIALERASVWNGAIVHAVWNIVILGGILSIGEKIDDYSIFTYVIKTTSFAITGGEFGIQSSILAIVGYIIVSLIAYVGIRKNIGSLFVDSGK